MLSQSRLLPIALALVAVASIATWLVTQRQHSDASHAARGLASSTNTLEAMISEQIALETFADTRNPRPAAPVIAAAHRRFDAAITELRALTTEPAERRALAHQEEAEDHWQGLWFALSSRHLSRRSVINLAPQRALLGSVTRAEQDLSALQIKRAAQAQDQADTISLWLLLIALIVLGGVTAASLLRNQTWLKGRQFNEMLSASSDEDEAYVLLKRHLERSTPGAEATVLVRNNSANRLEARTAVSSAAVNEHLVGAAPDSCLAVRLARPHRRRPGEDELLSCEICGASESATLCSPLIVGGEVMGSVLLTRRRRFAKVISARVSETLLLAAPAIANLRHLAIAETRAATDALTGLPNRRTVDDEVKRMVARAGRTGSNLAAAMLDIDHFKQVNDTYGHDRGDEQLAAVADTVAASIRGGDFVGRYGGEEFVVLLPDTDSAGAAQLAEKLRAAISELNLPGLPSVTVSIGVSAMPEDATDSGQLIRAADRALYLAKSLGRNRVQRSAGEPARTAAFAQPPNGLPLRSETGDRKASVESPTTD